MAALRQALLLLLLLLLMLLLLLLLLLILLLLLLLRFLHTTLRTASLPACQRVSHGKRQGLTPARA